MRTQTHRAEPACTSDGAPEVNVFLGEGDLFVAVTLTPEEGYALADSLVRAADAANRQAMAARQGGPR